MFLNVPRDGWLISFIFKILQRSLSSEKSERARIVLSMRNTVESLKETANVEEKLNEDVKKLKDELETSKFKKVRSRH